MFTFGLFSTHMPYVVMVVFYALYFLFASPTFNAGTESQADTSDDKTELVETNKTYGQQTADYFYAEPVNRNQLLCLKLPLKEHYHAPPDGISFQDVLAGALFSRPPPSFS
jgi:hypothetical protein